MRNRDLPKDTDLVGALPALRRAARVALRLAIETHTPCYVVRDGKIINIAATRPVCRRPTLRARQIAHDPGASQVVVRNGKVVHGKLAKKTSPLRGKGKGNHT